MISAEEVQKALDWLINSADAAAEARANRTQLEEFTKSLKAELTNEQATLHPDLAGNALERLALAQDAYRAHLDGLREAVRKDERFRWLAQCAYAKIDIWRTFEATKRSLKI